LFGGQSKHILEKINYWTRFRMQFLQFSKNNCSTGLSCLSNKISQLELVNFNFILEIFLRPLEVKWLVMGDGWFYHMHSIRHPSAYTKVGTPIQQPSVNLLCDWQSSH